MRTESQVKKYDLYDLSAFPEPMKRAWRDAHWENDLQRAYEAGQRMARKVLATT